MSYIVSLLCGTTSRWYMIINIFQNVSILSRTRNIIITTTSSLARNKEWVTYNNQHLSIKKRPYIVSLLHGTTSRWHNNQHLSTKKLPYIVSLLCRTMGRWYIIINIFRNVSSLEHEIHNYTHNISLLRGTRNE